MKQPDGGRFSEVSPDICFCVNTRRHRGVVLLPPVGFAIVTLVVCMLAAWNGDSLAVLPLVRSEYGWRCLRVIVGADAFSVAGISPKYSQPLVEISLWASLGWWIVALFWCCFTQVPQQSGVTLKHCAYFWRANHCSLLLGHAGVTGLHYDENHYSGAIWLLYVMILVGALTLAHICLANCLVNISWPKGFSG